MKLIANLDEAGQPTEARGILDPVDEEGWNDLHLANSLVRGRKLGLQNLWVGDKESDGLPYILFYEKSGWDSFEGLIREMLRLQKILSGVLSEAHKIEYLCGRLKEAKAKNEGGE